MSAFMHLLHCAKTAKEASGVGYLRQIADCLVLARPPSRIGPDEYFDFRLYDPSLPMNAKREFIGYKAEVDYSRLNLSSWDATANDKVLFEQVMLAAGHFSPPNFALFHPWRVAGEHCANIRNRDDLHHFLEKCADYPLFVKPVHGLFGRSTAVISAYDDEHRTIQLKGSGEQTLDQFHVWLESNSRQGMIFQKMLQPSEEVRQICGERLSSVRMIVLCDDDRPRLFRANWKLCTGNNFVDNTDGWRNGNIVAAIDHANGLVQQAYRGVSGKRSEVAQHPDTHASLIGLKVPNWDAMQSFVENVARAFPGVRFQAWDIAATSEGVCALELNLTTLHTVFATQLVSHKGFLDQRLVNAMQRLKGR